MCVLRPWCQDLLTQPPTPSLFPQMAGMETLASTASPKVES